MAFDFERLEVYQRALGFVDEAYVLAKAFPSDERFALGDQLRRAAISIALNIAEGSGRTKKDFRNFLRNSRASCYECAAVLHVASRRSYISRDRIQVCQDCLVGVAKMISGLMRSLGGETS